MLRVLLAVFSQILKLNETLKYLKKIRDAKGRFHAKIGTIKDKSGKDLTEAEQTKQRAIHY